MRKHEFLSNQWTVESRRQRPDKDYAEAFLVARKVSRAAMLLEQESLLWRAVDS